MAEQLEMEREMGLNIRTLLWLVLKSEVWKEICPQE